MFKLFSAAVGWWITAVGWQALNPVYLFVAIIMHAVGTAALVSFAAGQQDGEQSHTTANTEVTETTNLDDAVVEDSDTEQANDLNFMVLKGMLADMPAWNSRNDGDGSSVAELVELLDDGDLSLKCIFLKERFRFYFHSLDKIVMTCTPVEDLQKAWMKTEAMKLLSNYLCMKKFSMGLGVQLQDLPVKDQKQLSLASLSLGELPLPQVSLCQKVVEEKTSCWLQTVPASVRTRNSDASLRKEWVADNFQHC